MAPFGICKHALKTGPSSGTVRREAVAPSHGPRIGLSMSPDKRDLVEARIQEARQRGDFDDLAGRSKPLELEELPGASSEERFEALLMRSMGEVSAEVLLVREIRARRMALEQIVDPGERQRLLSELQEKRDELSAALKERKTRREKGG